MVLRRFDGVLVSKPMSGGRQPSPVKKVVEFAHGDGHG